MQTLIATLVVVAIVMLAMAIGTLWNGRPLRGSCGGTGQGCPCTEAERQRCARRERGAAS